MEPDVAPLASLSQIQQTPSGRDGIPQDLEEDLRAYGAKMIQQAGILLKQLVFSNISYSPKVWDSCLHRAQETGGHVYRPGSVPEILVHQFHGKIRNSSKSWPSPKDIISSYNPLQEIGMGALYLASKLEECPLRMRDVINVYDVLIQRSQHSSSPSDFKHEPMSYFSQPYYDMKDVLIIAEMQLLKRLGFDVHVTLPYGTLVNYMRVLNLLEDTKACQMAWGYLNDAYGN
jgi:hypothetical protein